MANYKKVLGIVKSSYDKDSKSFQVTPEMFEDVKFSTKKGSNTPREVTVNNAVFQAAIYLNMAGAKITRQQFMEIVRTNCIKNENISAIENVLNALGVKNDTDIVPAKVYGHKKTGVALNITQSADEIKSYLEENKLLTVEPVLVYPEAGKSGTAKDNSIGMDFEEFSFGDDEEE